MCFRLYDEYSFQVIPVLGQLIASDWHSYQYLVESIRQFPAQVMQCEMTGTCTCALSVITVTGAVRLYATPVRVKFMSMKCHCEPEDSFCA